VKFAECAELCREAQEHVARLIGTIARIPGMTPLEMVCKAAEIGKWAKAAGDSFQAAAQADEEFHRNNSGSGI
jgi:hypothetical protein